MNFVDVPVPVIDLDDPEFVVIPPEEPRPHEQAEMDAEAEVIDGADMDLGPTNWDEMNLWDLKLFDKLDDRMQKTFISNFIRGIILLTF